MAKKDLSHLEDAPRKPRPPEPSPTPARGEAKAVTPRPEWRPVPREAPATKTPNDWKASKECFFCGKVGHIQPDCPIKKAGGVKKISTIAMSGNKREGPYLAVDVSAGEEHSDRTLRMMAHVDSGAKLGALP